ncbi:hypothetical protein HK405_015112, partial [Cladochytrium tenue]
ISINLHAEVESQNSLLDTLSGTVDSAVDGLRGTTRRLRAAFDAAPARQQAWIVGGLVAFVLLVLWGVAARLGGGDSGGRL